MKHIVGAVKLSEIRRRGSEMPPPPLPHHARALAGDAAPADRLSASPPEQRARTGSLLDVRGERKGVLNTAGTNSCRFQETGKGSCLLAVLPAAIFHANMAADGRTRGPMASGKAGK